MKIVVQKKLGVKIKYKIFSEIGIYAIVNTRTEKFYIGSTVNSFRSRYALHKSSLLKNKHSSIKLQRAWNKQNGEDFEFWILETVKKEELIDKDYVLDLEQTWLDATNCVKTGYNIAPKAFNCAGIKRSEAFRENVSKARSSNVYLIFDPEGNSYKTDCLSEFCKIHNLSRTASLCLRKAANGQTSGYKGWTCHYFDGNTKPFLPMPQGKKYVVTDPRGRRFDVHNMAEFCRQNDLSQAGMSSVARGKVNFHRGWKCEFADGSSPKCTKPTREKKWILTDPDGVEYYTTNLAKFCSERGLNVKAMSEVAYGKAKRHKKWKCRYADGTSPRFQPKIKPPVKHWIAIAPDGTEYRTDNMSEFCRQHNLIMAGMSNVARGKASQHKGWKCHHVTEQES